MKEKAGQLLGQAFFPSYLRIEDQSHLHAGHNPDAAKGGTHLYVTLYASVFEGKSLVQRHKLVNDAMAPCFDAGLHALKISAQIPSDNGSDTAR